MMGRLIMFSPCCLTSERIADVFSPVRLARGPVTLSVKEEKREKASEEAVSCREGFVSV